MLFRYLNRYLNRYLFTYRCEYFGKLDSFYHEKKTGSKGHKKIYSKNDLAGLEDSNNVNDKNYDQRKFSIHEFLSFYELHKFDLSSFRNKKKSKCVHKQLLYKNLK